MCINLTWVCGAHPMGGKSALRLALDFIEDAEGATSMTELEKLMRLALAEFGVTDYSMTAAAPRPDNGARIPTKLTSAVNPVWSDRYLERKYYNVDYCVHLALRQPHAFSWADFERRSMPDASRALFAESRDCLKIDGGFIVPTDDSGGFAGLICMFHEQRVL